MTLNNKNKRSKKIIIICLLLTVIASSGVFAYSQINRPSTPNDAINNENKEKPRSDSAETPHKDLDKPTNKESSNTSSNNTKHVTQYSDDKGNPIDSSSSSSSASIIAFQNGQVVRVNITINSVWNTGSCTLSITNKSLSITKKSAIQAMPSYSTCQGFSIPVSELGVGTWKINLTASHDSQTAVANQEVPVQ